MLQKIYRCSTA